MIHIKRVSYDQGYRMVVTTWSHNIDPFLLKETYIFLDFVKSDVETVKIQLNPWPKKDFLKVHEANFLPFS